MNTPEGICIKCGARYVGWALADPGHRTCRVCDGEVTILKTAQGSRIGDGSIEGREAQDREGENYE